MFRIYTIREVMSTRFVKFVVDNYTQRVYNYFWKAGKYMTKFSETLKCLRLSHKITQEELAKVLGVSPSTIGMYEAGKRQPNFEMEEKIADYFNVTLDTLRGVPEKPDMQTVNVNGTIFMEYMALSDEQKKQVDSYIKFLKSQEDKK